jgi:hypothetical protein
LTIRAHRKVVVDIDTPTSWLAKDRSLCRTCTEVCQNPAFLHAGYTDEARTLALLTISYVGTDTCPEPSSQHHVVSW